jgi:hypothetical protein
MSVVVSDIRNASYDGNINTANGFYRAEFANLCPFFGTLISFSTTATTYGLTFANAGNLMGVVLPLQPNANFINTTLTVTLEENVASVWTARTSKTLTAAELVKSPNTPTATVFDNTEAGIFGVFKFATPYAVDTVGSKWRISVVQGAGSGTWRVRQSTTNVWGIVAWCNNAVSYTDGVDQLCVVDSLKMNASTFLVGASQTGDPGTSQIAAWVCGGSDRSLANGPLLKLDGMGSVSTTIRIMGLIIYDSIGGVEFGTKAFPVVNKLVEWVQPKIGVAANSLVNNRDSFGIVPMACSVSSSTGALTIVGKGGNFSFVGEVPAIQRTTFTLASGTTLTLADTSTGWAPGDRLLIGRVTAQGCPDLNVYTISTISGGDVVLTTSIANARTTDGTVARLNGYGLKQVSWSRFGDSTTAYTISTPSGTTKRYTYVSGTASNISAVNLKIGSEVVINGQNFNAANNGRFVITGIATNYFEINNPAGVNESTKTLGTGDLFGEGVGAKLNIPGAHNTIVYGNELSNVSFFQGSSSLTLRTQLGTDVPHEYCCSSFVSWGSGSNFLLASFSTCQPAGIILNNCDFFHACHTSGFGVNNGQGTILADNNYHFCINAYGAISFGLNGVHTCTNNIFDGGTSGYMQVLYRALKGSTFAHNKFWGSQAFGGTNLGALALNTVVFLTDWHSNTYDNNACAIQVGGISTVFDCKATGDEFGQIVPNTVDVFSYFRGLPQIEFNNCKGNMTTGYYNAIQSSQLAGAEIILSKVNQVEGNDRIEKNEGTLYKAGVGLSDTTHHTSDYCFKFVPTYNNTDPNFVPGPIEWEQKIPTENIQNKNMAVGLWVKLSNSAYWAGTHQMPRLTINYDDGSIVYAEAGQVTDWQYIQAPFTPLTTYGEITVTVSGKSDAGVTNSPFYVAEMSVLYPAGHKIEMGLMNTWSSASPTKPSISTVASASDVWAVDPTSFGASTVGDKVNKIKKIVTGLQ